MTDARRIWSSLPPPAPPEGGREPAEIQAPETGNQATRDSLTGLLDRAHFDVQYRQRLSRCAEKASTLGVILLDLDRLTQLNEAWGRAFGDEILQRVARVLQRTVRKSDVLARYGGEEFVLLAVQSTERGLGKVAERIRAAVEREEIQCGDQRALVTVSVGAALALPGRAGSEPGLLAAAEGAVYEAKRAGRNRVHVRSLLDDGERRIAQKVAQRRLSRWLVNRNVLDIPAVSQALIRYDGASRRLGSLAVQHGVMTGEQAEQVAREQEQTRLRFGETAIQLGVLDEERLVRLLALQQEDPVSLARVLVRMGLLERRQAAELLADYMAETTSNRSFPIRDAV